MKNSLVLGVSSSGGSTDVIKALQWANDQGMKISVISSKDMSFEIPNLTKVLLGTEYYHTAEVLTLLLTYELTHGSGNVCPPIGKNSPDELERLNWKGGKVREHSYPDEKVNVGIDFDGVIHKCSRGYYDGTVYDEPVDGAFEALKSLSRDHVVIVYTCKAKPDRGLVNGKTGTELVWEWLENHNMAQFVSKVTAEKPRAKFYIDDKAIKFNNWSETLLEVGLLTKSESSEKNV